MRKRLLLLAGVAAAVSVCLAQPATPNIGLIRDQAGSIRRVDGVAGSFYPGPELARGVIAFAYSGARGILIEPGQISLVKPDGTALRVESARTGNATAALWNDLPAAWLPEESRALVFGDKETRSISLRLAPGEELLDFSHQDGLLTGAVWREDRVHLITYDPSTGEPRSAEATAIDSRTCALGAGASVIWTQGTRVLLRKSDLSVQEVDAGTALHAFRHSAKNWIQALSEDGRVFLIRLTPALEVFEVPAIVTGEETQP